MVEKEFGKLTRGQAKQAYASLHEMNEEVKDLEQLASETTNLDELVTSWAEWYEQPFVNNLVYFVLSLGLGEELKRVSNAPDPQQAFFDFFQSDLADSIPAEDFDVEQKQVVTSLLMGLLGQINSIKQYSQPLSVLVEKASQGDLDSLFRAVTIDRVVVACPSIAKQIAMAQMVGDESFMNRLSKAITRTKPVRPKLQYDDFRYMLEAVVDGVGIESFSSTELEDLLKHELELYTNDSDYSLRAFRKLIQKRNQLVGT
ncbi:MAG: hypothetical protein V7739_03205 [Motiliproteus sp.]